jgi:hypothetical protein
MEHETNKCPVCGGEAEERTKKISTWRRQELPEPQEVKYIQCLNPECSERCYHAKEVKKLDKYYEKAVINRPRQSNERESSNTR